MNFSSLLKRSALAAVLLAIAALPMSSGVKREVRSVWMATVWALDWPSSTSSTTAQKNEMVKYLDVLQKNNFNAVYFQVRTMSDAFYKSSYEPWSSYLTGTRGKDPGWDPLAFVVEECHKRGMECHAWVNPYRFSTGSNWSTAQDQALKSAGMLLAYTKSDGKTTTILNPGLESVRKRIVDVCKEIISNYDVDGLVFDDYFYPEGIPVTSSAGDYDLWQKSGASMTFGDWRRNNVNQMVADVYKMVQQQKPYVRFGISPAGNINTVYEKQYADVYRWCSEDGYLDYICPQVYFGLEHQTYDFKKVSNTFAGIIKNSSVELIIGMTLGKAKSGTDQYAGTGKYEWRDNKDVLVRCLEYTKSVKHCSGVAYFCYQYFYDPISGVSVTETKAERDKFIPLLKTITWNE